jgi:hypothetical protein
MEKNVTMKNDELQLVEEYLYEAGKQAQREADARIIKDQFGQEYIVDCGKVIEKIEERHLHLVSPNAMYLSTLDGLIDYINNDPDHILHNSEIYQILVKTPVEVCLVSPATGFFKERAVYVRCEADVPDLSLGRFMDTEKFQVMLQTCFVPSTNLDLVLQLAGSVRKEQNLQTADDGVSQKVTINTGVTTASDVIVKNPVELMPFRTFVEVEQPISPFVLRFNQDGEAALFTGAGKSWAVEAKKKIVAYLQKKLINTSANVFVLS